MPHLRDSFDASVKADDLLKQLANAHNLTADEHRDAATDLLACAQMMATRDDYAVKAQTLASLAVAHAAVASISDSDPTRTPSGPAAPTLPSRVRFNPGDKPPSSGDASRQSGLRR